MYPLKEQYKVQVNFSTCDAICEANFRIKLLEEDLENESSDDSEEYTLEIREETAEAIAEDFVDSIDFLDSKWSYDNVVFQNIETSFGAYVTSELIEDKIYQIEHQAPETAIEGSLIVTIDKKDVEYEFDEDWLEDEECNIEEKITELLEEIAEEIAQEVLSELDLNYQYSLYEQIINPDKIVIELDSGSAYWSLDFIILTDSAPQATDKAILI
ncbi:MAG: hypothetical protein ACFBSE_27375 [Prochloraceae cyanobacterium]